MRRCRVCPLANSGTIKYGVNVGYYLRELMIDVKDRGLASEICQVLRMLLKEALVLPVTDLPIMGSQ